MSTPESKKWLDAGIAAVKSGDTKTARAMLAKVVELEERNEQAWLWLSAVAETVEDRRICLENVLALNPESRVAQKGLARLDDWALNSSDEAVAEQTLSHQESGPYQPMRSRAPVTTSVAKGAANLREAAKEDVWDTDEDICAFCAAVVGEKDRRCPNCRRSLIRLQFRYPATAVLHIFWVFLFSVALILGFQAMFKYRLEQRPSDAILHAVLAGFLVLAVIGVNLRLFIAHIFSILVLILVMILGVYNFLTPFEPAAVGTEFGDVALRGLTAGFLSRLGLLLEVVQVALGGAALFYATLRAGPEFERVEERNIARTERGLRTAVDYHLVARRMRQRGRWASAVLHWQRAAAINPNKVTYQRELARAYMHLGYPARAVDVLQSARKLPMQPSIQSDVDRLHQRALRQVSARRMEQR